MPAFDVAGVGLNATDTVVFLRRFPAHSAKEQIVREVVSPGGQVASALAACSRLGLRTKYVGAIGDDERGAVQRASLISAGIDVSDLKVRPACSSQSAYIIVDGPTAERTILWSRDERLALAPEEITPAQIQSARLLHIDGHDTAAVARAASIARAAGIPVSADIDTIYPGLDRVLPNIDYLVSSARFPEKWTGEPDPFRALELLHIEYGTRVVAMTLGDRGALARADGVYHYSPGYEIDAVDTTGAGDVFHGGFCYAVLEGMKMLCALDFANAMAALNCAAPGARGGIRGLAEVRAFMARAARRIDPEFVTRSDLTN